MVFLFRILRISRHRLASRLHRIARTLSEAISRELVKSQTTFPEIRPHFVRFPSVPEIDESPPGPRGAPPVRARRVRPLTGFLWCVPVSALRQKFRRLPVAATVPRRVNRRP